MPLNKISPPTGKSAETVEAAFLAGMESSGWKALIDAAKW